MPKYMFEVSYSSQGVEGVKSKGGSSRREAVAEMAENLGGKLESFYFAFGDQDAYVIVDLPDNETAAAVVLAVNSAGGAALKTVQLLTPEEIDVAAKRSVGYHPPGS